MLLKCQTAVLNSAEYFQAVGKVEVGEHTRVIDSSEVTKLLLVASKVDAH